MDTLKLREQLEIDEGIKFEIYLDHLGFATCGIGHLVKKTDEEFGKPVGTKITKERAYELFEQDIKITIEDCCKLFDNFPKLHEELQQIIANMMFNVGYTRLSKFVKFIQAIKDKDYLEAEKQMINSRWYKQVGDRAKRLCKRMRNLAFCTISKNNTLV
jgi:lysozyme